MPSLPTEAVTLQALKWHPDRHHTNKEYASKRFVEVRVQLSSVLTPYLTEIDV